MGLFSTRGAAAGDVARADALIAEGQAFEDSGKPATAEEKYRAAIAAAPRHARAHLNLGNALRALGALPAACDAYRAAIESDPAYAPAHCNLGVALALQSDAPRAQEHFERALALAPDMAPAAVYLARLKATRGDFAGAVLSMRQAIAADPAPWMVHVELAEWLLRLDRHDEARAAYEAALAREPRSEAALLGLGRDAFAAGDPVRACAFYKRGLEVAPRSEELWMPYLLSLNVRDDLSPQEVAQEHFRYGAIFDDPKVQRPPARSRAGRRLRVGYVSPDFRNTPVAWFIAPLLERHDRARVEVFCYSNAPREDEVTVRIKRSAEHWRSINGLDAAAVVDKIRADGIDVLVDLAGHTLWNRLDVFARRAAPVQATWLGYLNTTGLKAIDYRITDAQTDPVGETEAMHSEGLVRLPHCQWSWVPFYDAAPRVVPDARPGQPVTFGSFNYANKITEATLALWGEVLRRVSDARLRVHGAQRADFIERLRARLEAHGIARSRVTIVEPLPIQRFYECFRDVDIALDTMPYNGGTTTLITYWMGVPLVALRGDRGIARGAYSIAHSAGLDELIARDAADFVERNVELARDGARRVALARSLRDRLMASPIGDASGFARDLEDLYLRMHDDRGQTTVD